MRDGGWGTPGKVYEAWAGRPWGKSTA